MTEPGGSLVVSEVFGPTVQGEGPSSGKLCSFVRLGGCNLHCSWCDTPYTWDAKAYNLRDELRRVPVTDLLDFVETVGAPLLVVTGGEPLLHQRLPGFRQLVEQAIATRVEIETNGTLTPAQWLLSTSAVHFNVSPKLQHAGDPEHKRIQPHTLEQFRRLGVHGRACFKFVVRTDTDLQMQLDLAEVERLVGAHQLGPVWVMPEGTTPERIAAGIERIADPVVERGWNLSSRLHVMAWGNERGR